MWLTAVGNTLLQAANSSDEEKAWLREYLSFETTQFRGGGRPVQTTERLYNLLNDTFPAGFLKLVIKAATREGFEVTVVDPRKAPALFDPNADLAWLRDYQQLAVDTVVENRRGILQLPTGAGKTEVAVALTRALPTTWLFLVHRVTLMDQAAERYELRTGKLAGRIGEGQWDIPPDCEFICATFSTMSKLVEKGDARALALLKSVGGLIVDECHVVPALTHWAVTMTCQAYWRVGLSGTPLDRGDKRSLLAIAALGPVLYRVPTQKLIELGVLAKPKVKFATCSQTSNCPTWQGVYGDCVVRSVKRNKLLAKLAVEASKPAFLFVKETSHGKRLVKELGRAGLKADFVFGNHSLEWRKSHVKRLVQGHYDVLVCSVIFQEGIDVPELRSVIIGAGGKSVIATLQRLGRGMRIEKDAKGVPVAGGDTFEVYDINDTGNKFLERHARERMRTYAGEGHETVVVPERPV